MDGWRACLLGRGNNVLSLHEMKQRIQTPPSYSIVKVSPGSSAAAGRKQHRVGIGILCL